MISNVEYGQIRNLCSELRTRMAGDVGAMGADFSDEASPNNTVNRSGESDGT